MTGLSDEFNPNADGGEFTPGVPNFKKRKHQHVTPRLADRDDIDARMRQIVDDIIARDAREGKLRWR